MNDALVILTGGKSSRMGSDKARLPFGNSTVLEYLIEKFQPVFPNIYLSVQKEEDYASLHLPVPVIEDRVQDCGPMGGIYSVLSGAKEERFLFISVDTPFANPQAAKRMLSFSAGHDISLVKRSDGKTESLFAVYTKECLPFLEKCLEEHHYALRRLHEKCAPHYVGESDLFPVSEDFYSDDDIFHCFFNMNTRKDYYFALRRLGLLEQTRQDIPVVSFVARSGTGKTTYLEKIIALLKEEGFRLAALKHDAHRFEIDKPGKDSYRFSKAGADHVILTSKEKTAAIIQHDDTIPFDTLLAQITNVDFIITEGYKHGNQPKIELLRKGYHEAPVSDPKDLVAVVSDFPYETKKPLFDLNRPEDIIPFLKRMINGTDISS